MLKLSFKERYLKALRREPVDRIPVPAFCSHPLLALMEHTGLFAPKIHYNLREMVNFALAGWEILGLEGVRLPIDGVIEAEAMGCRLDKGDAGRNPFVVDHPFFLGDVEIPDNFLERGRIPVVLEAIESVKEKVPSDIPVTTHFMGPTTIACHLVGPETFLKGLIKSPDEIVKVLNTVTGACIRMRDALCGAGADVLEIPDPMASPSVISPGAFEEFVLPCYKKILKPTPCPVILHICGNTNAILPLIKNCGAIGFSFDSMVDVSYARRILGEEMSLVGNISATDILVFGSKEEVRQETEKVIRDGIDVVAASCGFAPQTPLENLKEMIRTARTVAAT